MEKNLQSVINQYQQWLADAQLEAAIAKADAASLREQIEGNAGAKEE